jgi:hypothetical protein
MVGGAETTVVSGAGSVVVGGAVLAAATDWWAAIPSSSEEPAAALWSAATPATVNAVTATRRRPRPREELVVVMVVVVMVVIMKITAGPVVRPQFDCRPRRIIPTLYAPGRTPSIRRMTQVVPKHIRPPPARAAIVSATFPGADGPGSGIQHAQIVRFAPLAE